MDLLKYVLIVIVVLIAILVAVVIVGAIAYKAYVTSQYLAEASESLGTLLGTILAYAILIYFIVSLCRALFRRK